MLRTDPKKRRVFVEGLNIIKRHERPRSTGDMATASPGGIVEKEGPIHVSNVMLLDPKGNKGTRVGVRRDDDGKRVRYRQAQRGGGRLMEAGTVTPTRRRPRRRACARNTRARSCRR